MIVADTDAEGFDDLLMHTQVTQTEKNSLHIMADANPLEAASVEGELIEQEAGQLYGSTVTMLSQFLNLRCASGSSTQKVGDISDCVQGVLQEQQEEQYVANYEQPTPRLPICGLKAHSIIIPKEREALYDRMFLLYDLDESGLIDSHEEIEGLFMNTWFKFLAKSEIHTTSPSKKAAHYMATLKQVLANGNLGFTQHEWAQWFESNVYLQNQFVDL